MPAQRRAAAKGSRPGTRRPRAVTKKITLSVNGTKEERTVEPRVLLVDFLREHLGFTGAHVGCDTSQCGACTVLLDGRPVKSCSLFAVQAEGSDITTVEGLSIRGRMHPLQEAFRDHLGLQCGYCTPGMVLSAYALLRSNPSPTEDEIRVAISGNLCRCTGYQGIVQSISAAAGAPARDQPPH